MHIKTAQINIIQVHFVYFDIKIQKYSNAVSNPLDTFSFLLVQGPRPLETNE